MKYGWCEVQERKHEVHEVHIRSPGKYESEVRKRDSVLTFLAKSSRRCGEVAKVRQVCPFSLSASFRNLSFTPNRRSNYQDANKPSKNLQGFIPLCYLSVRLTGSCPHFSLTKGKTTPPRRHLEALDSLVL